MYSSAKYQQNIASCN